MRLVFKKLFLFAPAEKKAKAVEFIDGINIITSSQNDGTDRGKSLLMRSLYHALGAEGHFDKNWNTNDKVYILNLSIDNDDYYIYRSAQLFKFFDKDRVLLFTSISSSDLSLKLRDYTKFAVQLPNRAEKMEITPPAYNYIPFFLDQDHYAGNEYASFKNLGQYANFRENALFYHLGAFDENYFDLIHKKEELKDSNVQCLEQLKLLEAMLESFDKKIGGNDFSTSFEALKKDLSIYQEEYASVLNQLSEKKKKLIKLRNSLYEAEQMLKEIEEVSEDGEKKIRKLNNHTCPECGSILIDTVNLKSKQYNLIEDAIAIKNDLQTVILEDQKKIEKEEKEYVDLLEQMKEYEERLKLNSSESDEILRQKALSEVRDEVISDKYDLSQKIEDIQEDLKDISEGIKNYNEKKKAIEETYYELMVAARTKFGVNELIPENFKKLTNSVKASGSNKNVVTIMWYMAILELRSKFNKDAIKYPIVFDSINNVETDDEKRYGLFQYVVDKAENEQLVLSLLGYEENDIQTNRPIKIIRLTNDKYHLLDEISYKENGWLLEEMCDA